MKQNTCIWRQIANINTNSSGGILQLLLKITPFNISAKLQRFSKQAYINTWEKLNFEITCTFLEYVVVNFPQGKITLSKFMFHHVLCTSELTGKTSALVLLRYLRGKQILTNQTISLWHTLHKKCPYSELFWSIFSPNAGKCGPE